MVHITWDAEQNHQFDLTEEISEGFIFVLMTQESKVITLVGEVTVAQNGIVRGFELTYIQRSLQQGHGMWR